MDEQKRKLSPAEIAINRQRMFKVLREREEITKAQHLLNLKQAQIDNPIKPRVRKGRKKRRRR